MSSSIAVRLSELKELSNKARNRFRTYSRVDGGGEKGHRKYKEVHFSEIYVTIETHNDKKVKHLLMLWSELSPHTDMGAWAAEGQQCS